MSPASTIHALALRSHSSHNSREQHGSSCDHPCSAVWCGTVLLSQELAGDTVYSGMARRRPWLWPWLASALVAVAVSYAYLSLTGPGEHNRQVGSAESLQKSSSDAIVAPPAVNTRSLGLCGKAAPPPTWSECTACASTHTCELIPRARVCRGDSRLFRTRIRPWSNVSKARCGECIR